MPRREEGVLDRRPEPHDLNQLELKLAYQGDAGDEGSGSRRYLVETFAFLPRTLGFHRKAYGADDFYSDTAAFLRFKTPPVHLEELASGTGAEAWFDTLDEALLAAERDEAPASERAVRALRLLGCVYRGALREVSRPLRDRLVEATAGRAAVAEVALTAVSTLDRYCAQDLEARRRLVSYGERLQGTRETVAGAWQAVDEFVALQSEDETTLMLRALDRFIATHRDALATDGHLPRLEEARRRAAVHAVESFAYRRSRGYTTFALDDDPNEQLPFRRRVLKRFVFSALYLSVRQDQTGELPKDMIGGVAAALAMLFAILVTIWAQSTWAITSATFVSIMVFSYIIKDRIKEWAKRYLGRKLARWVPDHKLQILDPDTGAKVGSCRESFRVVEPHRLGEEILAMRHVDHPSPVAEAGRPEAVIHYAKEVTLRPNAFSGYIAGASGLNDIIRFNFQRLRARMDSAVEGYWHVHPETLEVVSTPCARVYHVNFVLRLTVGSGREPGSVQLDRVRVVMDQEGILRLEFVEWERTDDPDVPGGLRYVRTVTSSYRDEPATSA